METIAYRVELTAIDTIAKVQAAIVTNALTWPLMAVVIISDNLMRLCTGHGILK